MSARCKHEFRYMGRAKDYHGMGCNLWKCRLCGHLTELFIGVKPPRTVGRIPIEPGLAPEPF
jgi:hypothetical protein